MLSQPRRSRHIYLTGDSHNGPSPVLGDLKGGLDHKY
jgi:hypothetical protein